MKLLNDDRMRLVLVGIVAVIILSGGNVRAHFTFGEAVNLGPVVNSEQNELTHCVSADGLELYYMYGGSWEPNTPGWNLSVSTRSTVEDDWGPPANLGSIVNSLNDDMGPCISSDGLELYFQSNRPGGEGLDDIWVSRRATKDNPWGEPENLGPPVNTETWDYNPCLSSDGLKLYFAYGLDPQLAVTTRETRDAPWGEPVNLGPVVNSWSCQDAEWISSDDLVLVFSDFWGCDPRPEGLGETDIWLTRRASKEADWTTPVNIGAPINTEFAEDAPMISVDGSMLYFNSDRPGGSGNMDIWQAPIIPIVDLNADGIVDAADVCILVDNWGTDNSLCDIGPMPWGDGVVDVQDLIVLAEHLFEVVPPAESIK
jgi:Tol biopolymer transport system component